MKSVRAVGMLLVVALVLGAVTSGASAQGPERAGGRWRGEPPATPGVHLAVWDGGAIVQAVATPGLRSLWLTVEGGYVGYVVDAPAFVNAAFRVHFPEGTLPAGTGVVLVLGQTEDASPEAVVEQLFADLELAAPPVSSEPALVRALSRLSVDTRARITTSGQVAALIGVQDLPDAGLELTLRTQDQDETRVHALLRYSGGDAEREFLLLRERDRWHIDWVDAHPMHPGSSPEAVTQAFLAHFIAAAPPAASPRPAMRASELLTEAARAGLPRDFPLASALAMLVGVQDLPDLGVDVAAATIEGYRATLTATLRYSGGDAERTFTLAREATGWRIDRIEP